MRLTQQQWLTLFQAQPDSHLSIKDFCLEQGVSTSSFYKHKALLITKPQTLVPSPFSQVQLIEPERENNHCIKLNVGNVNITLNGKTDVHWLANLVGQLA